MLKLNCWPFAFTLYHTLKKKRSPELVSIPHFPYNFWRKISLTLYFINWSNAIVWLPLIFEILGNICIVISYCLICDVINFEINHGFFIKPFFHITKRSGQNINISGTKRAFNMNIKAFFIIFKVLSIVRKISDPRVDL